MKAKNVFFVSMLLVYGCESHLKPEDIYSSGEVENFDDFFEQKVTDYNVDSCLNYYPHELLEKYVFKSDTNFKVYIVSDSDIVAKKKVFRNLAFIYKGKFEGKSTIFSTDGSYFMTMWFKNNQIVKYEKEKKPNGFPNLPE